MVNEAMAAKVKPMRPSGELILLDKTRTRPRRFSQHRPRVVGSAEGVRTSVAQATQDTLWISYDRGLTEVLARSLRGPARPLGKALLLHPLTAQTIAGLASSFKRFAVASNDQFLPPEELAEALGAEDSRDLVIGGSVDSVSRTLTLWRGNLEPLTVPFSAFEESGDGIAPDFDRFSVTDFGQTLRLGDFESSTEAVLYEFDVVYRRRLRKRRRESERSLGASLRRLRKQRGLRREDFEPEIASKTIARIEQGKVKRVREGTLRAIAQRLRVKPEDIPTF